ncbi:CHAT domain-containing protein [Lewinella sp. IMCC34183]|uniref:DUF7379 domain-containing protein n=1 Tax=Lewinella sp. IMCC34183 TaxID=2248762 RepID=UPI000E24BB74|nr:CHAT domain-containing protein [Lewinella sp. IMCC34183]
MTEPYTLTIRGNRLTEREIGDRIPGDFTVRAAYELQNNRAQSMSYPENLTTEIVNLRTEEGVEWLGLPDDLPEVYGTYLSPARGDSSGFLVPNTIGAPTDQTRGFLQEVKAKVLEIITRRAVDTAARTTAGQVAHRIDAHLLARRGLFAVSARGELGAAVPAIHPGGKALVFIHGTISNFEQGFAGVEPRFWQRIHERYDGRVYAFNHATLTVSPVGNALELLATLPDDLELDLITHSRGGLVADALARCDGRLMDKGFRKEEIGRVQADFDASDADGSELLTAMEQLGSAAASRNLRVDRIVRVACPAQGTVLLSERLDHYLNAMLALVGQGTGLGLSPLYQLVKEFILEVIDQRSDPAIFPGLYAMVPDRAYSKVNNNPTLHLPCKLFSIVGDADVGGGVLTSLKVILANLYYWHENDLVVNSSSMSRGILRREVNQVCRVEGEHVDHFSYFDEPFHMEIVVSLLEGNPPPTGVTLRDQLGEEATSGPASDVGDLISNGNNFTKPTIVLLPGIMGSNLYAGNDCQWVSVGALHRGGFVRRLHVGANDVEARSLVERSYGGFVRKMEEQGVGVRVLPYDWRLSLEEAATELESVMQAAHKSEYPVYVLAHSMGGLVVREWIGKYSDSWKQYRGRPGAQVVLLGTPWRGSHLITEILTGHGKRVRQLGLLDFEHSRQQVLHVLARLPGLYELLPLDEPEMVKAGYWRDLRKTVGEEHMAEIPEELLEHLADYRQRARDYIDKLEAKDWKHITYVAGHYPTTVDGFRETYSFFRKGKRIRYTTVAQGDGSVTWARGIPRKIPRGNVYYTGVPHAELANAPELFAGLLDLLRTGKTARPTFSNTAPPGSGYRGAVGVANRVTAAQPPVAELSPVENLLGGQPGRRRAPGEVAPVRVTVFNGDLRWAEYPVMVGHFSHDGIVSAERALDGYLNRTLSERHGMGFYPGDVGEQDVIVDPASYPRGALIVGLGDKDELTGYNLMRTVEKGVLKYAVFCRDHYPPPGGAFSQGISTVLIGSDYGQMPLRESVRSILMGVQRANELIVRLRSQRPGLRPITNVQFVDFYEDRSYECFKLLQDIASRERSLPLAVTPSITRGFGSRKRFLRENGRSWWQTFTTVVRSEPPKKPGGHSRKYLDFTADNRAAAISSDFVISNLRQARFLAEEMARESTWDPVSAKVLFEMLVPNRYKDFIRNHRNISWRMDEESASFPWEMFHDPQCGEQPTFVRSGMIRQLYSATARVRPALVRDNCALVIAMSDFSATREPGYEGIALGDIPGAAREGAAVADRLNLYGYSVNSLINSSPLSIYKALLGRGSKIVHIASHGIYDPENDHVGIEIGSPDPITPGSLRQMSDVPELVFINCCHLGATRSGVEAYDAHRHDLAANVGTQLIQIGVKAVIVAGWAVDDAAAATFAGTFYEEMLTGCYFGEAVRRARQVCYEQHTQRNTWGAYQCYGDPYYQTELIASTPAPEGSFSLEQELLLELENLISRSRSLPPFRDASLLQGLRTDVHAIVARAEAAPCYTSRIKRLEARFHVLMGDYAVALLRLRELFEATDDAYGVEDVYLYCNIRAKHLVAQRAWKQETGAVAAADTASTEVSGGENGAAQNDELRSILNDLRLPRLISPGHALLASKASTYKRAAMLCVADNTTRYLRYAADNYLAAARRDGTGQRSSIYYVTSFLTLATFCSTDPKRAVNVPKALGFDAYSYLDGWLQEPSGSRQRFEELYEQLADTQLRRCKLVVSAAGNDLSGAERNELVREIILLNDEQLGTAINVRDYFGEKEHLEFLIRMSDRLGSPFKQLRAEAEQILDALTDSWPG